MFQTDKNQRDYSVVIDKLRVSFLWDGDDFGDVPQRVHLSAPFLSHQTEQVAEERRVRECRLVYLRGIPSLPTDFQYPSFVITSCNSSSEMSAFRQSFGTLCPVGSLASSPGRVSYIVFRPRSTNVLQGFTVMQNISVLVAALAVCVGALGGNFAYVPRDVLPRFQAEQEKSIYFLDESKQPNNLCSVYFRCDAKDNCVPSPVSLLRFVYDETEARKRYPNQRHR
ncbi:MAG: uncharacterized protein A8A55_3209 [Amphiamblys sp. WSBS2006]|nr:MAG: uncharacterized protein A8A55_3209 [Amphiamblys sp. WSBS2006]